MKPEIKERVEKIRNGEVPEGYKETNVGIIPVDWVLNPLISISSMNGRIGWQGLKQSEFTMNPDDPFLITGMNFKDGKIRWEEVYHIPHNRYDEAKKIQLRIDDVLMTKDGTIGKLLYVDQIPYPNKASLNSHLLVLRPLYNKYIPKFLFYQLDSNIFKKYIELVKSGTTFFGITQEGVGKYKILYPLLPEQQKIADILSTWDKAIELKEKLIEEKKEFKRGLMQKLLVGKIRFKEYVKSPNLHEVKRYGTLPEDWSAKKASSIFSNVSIKNNGNEQLLSATQNNGVIPRDMLDGDVMSPSGDTKGYKLVEDGDFVISLRSFQGGIEYSSYRGLISPAYTVMKNKIPICKDFYRYIFKSKLFIDRLASSVIGIRDGKQISYNDFSFMFLPYPELKEQEKIAFTLKNLDDNIELLELELNQLKEQKRGLMQLLITGIVRVEVN